jgi:hypothetical protein
MLSDRHFDAANACGEFASGKSTAAPFARPRQELLFAREYIGRTLFPHDKAVSTMEYLERRDGL